VCPARRIERPRIPERGSSDPLISRETIVLSTSIFKKLRGSARPSLLLSWCFGVAGAEALYFMNSADRFEDHPIGAILVAAVAIFVISGVDLFR